MMNSLSFYIQGKEGTTTFNTYTYFWILKAWFIMQMNTFSTSFRHLVALQKSSKQRKVCYKHET